MKHFFRALQFSIKGLVTTFKYEIAFRQEIGLFIIGIPLAFWLGENKWEILALIGSLWMVLIVELINSAIENILDKTVPQFSKRAGRAKDQGSAAVMLTLILAGAIWGMVAYQQFY